MKFNKYIMNIYKFQICFLKLKVLTLLKLILWFLIFFIVYMYYYYEISR